MGRGEVDGPDDPAPQLGGLDRAGEDRPGDPVDGRLQQRLEAPGEGHGGRIRTPSVSAPCDDNTGGWRRLRHRPAGGRATALPGCAGYSTGVRPAGFAYDTARPGAGLQHRRAAPGYGTARPWAGLQHRRAAPGYRLVGQ
jgi:hypothetical protein